MLSDQFRHPLESWHRASTDHHTCIPVKSKWTVCFTDARFACPSVSGRIMSRKIIFTTLFRPFFFFSPISTSASYIHHAGHHCFLFIRWHTEPTLILLFFCCLQDQDEILLLWDSQQGTPKVTLFPDTDVTKLYTCALKQILTGQWAKGKV